MYEIFRRGVVSGTVVFAVMGIVFWAALGNAQKQINGPATLVEDYLHSLHLVAPEALPESGTFWSLAKDEPPLPFFQYANLDVDVPVPVYLLGRDGDQCSFLVDDRAVVELEMLLEAAEREIGLAQTMDSGPPVPAEGEEGG